MLTMFIKTYWINIVVKTQPNYLNRHVFSPVSLQLWRILYYNLLLRKKCSLKVKLKEVWVVQNLFSNGYLSFSVHSSGPGPQPSTCIFRQRSPICIYQPQLSFFYRPRYSIFVCLFFVLQLQFLIVIVKT